MKYAVKNINGYMIGIIVFNSQIVELLINERKDYPIEWSDLHEEAFKQLEEYFNKERQTFNLPLNPVGTNFQKKVWDELVKIPYGSTSNYHEIAQRINIPTGYRAVGNANGKNPIPIIIPCHRVIKKNGQLGGYSGGDELKKDLLLLEGVRK